MGTWAFELWGAWKSYACPIVGMASGNGSSSQEREYGKENKRLDMQKHLRCHFASRINLQVSAGSGEDGAGKLCI